MQSLRVFSKGLALAALGGFLLTAVARADERNLSGMYSAEVLGHWKGIFEAHVNGTVKVNIAPHLNAAGAARLRTLSLTLPVDPATGRLFDFSYNARTRTVLLPVFSVKFLYDMLATVAWLQGAGYDNRTFLYMVALKYKDARNFPRGRYLSPLEAFGIPRSNLMEVKFDSFTTQLVFEEFFNSAMLFVVAHEVGHGFDDEFDRHSPREREEFADVFAADMLGRDEFTYIGIVDLLANWVLWEKNVADFSSKEEYAKWLSSRGHHPMSNERVRMIGRHLVTYADTLFAPSGRREAQVSRARSLGRDLLGAADTMQDLEGRTDLRRLGERFNVASLDVSKQTKPAPRSDVAKMPIPEEPTDIRKGPARKLSDMPDAADLVKLSGSWWNMTLEEFLSASGLRAGQYRAGDDPSDKRRKVLSPVPAASRTLWSPPELEPFVFSFDEKFGLVEISGFLGGRKEDEFLKILTSRYGEPTRVMKALDFVTYAWEYDQSALTLNFMSFQITPMR